MTNRWRLAPPLLASVLLCRALPALGAVTISLRAPLDANVAEAEALISGLLESPTKHAGQGLVRYRAAGWSVNRDLQSRQRALSLLKTAWGEALQVQEEDRLVGNADGAAAAPLAKPASFGHADFVSAGQAALAVIPASLIAGQHGQAYDNRFAAGQPAIRLARAAAVAPPAPGPSSAPPQPRLAKPAAIKRGDPASPRADRRDTEFEDAIIGLIDELSAKDPVLFKKIRAEEDRIRALPSLEERVAAVDNAYPRLERELDKSAAAGKLSPEGAARWAVFRAQAQAALADGTLFERALFAGKTFDDKVQRLLDSGTTRLDPDKKLPEKKSEYMKLSQSIHDELSIAGNSTALTPRQIDRAFEIVGGEYGIRPEFLKYMAKTESGLKQTVPSNPAAVGIMQIEKVHREAYSGPRNVANDTITNIVYGGLLRAQTDRTMAKRFTEAAIAPPSNPRVVEFLGDLAYNRGPGLLKHVAQHAARQGINVNEFGEYVGGPGGSYTITNGGKNVTINPGPGTGIDRTGKGSVLERSSEAVGRVSLSRKLTEGLGDRNGDGRVDHLDIWLTRGIKYLREPKLELSSSTPTK